jgi:RHS repeat-associated protein
MYATDLRTAQNSDYIYLGGSLVAIRSKATATGVLTTKYQHTDALGSPIAVSSSTRTLLERSEYEPYGKLLNRSLTDGPGYTGHVSDSATGLSYMQQRYYDPGIGRFLSVDPVTANGNTGGNFNRYKYAANNPYKFIDPDGRYDGLTGTRIGKNRDMVQMIGPIDRSPAESSKRTDLKFQPVPGHTALNKADKKGEGRGEFGTPRNTARGRSTHSGIDIQAPKGADVVATQDGVVVDIRPNPSGTYGNQVVVDHGGGVFTQYAHLNSVAVAPGDPVNGGEQVGTVGRTGNTPSLGDTHLHFELRLNSPAPRSAGGTVADPLPYLEDK